MNHIKWVYLAIALFAITVNDSVWAHDRKGSGNRHLHQDHRHVGGGHYHAGGRHRHNRSRVNLGINLGYYNSGFLGSGYYNPGYAGPGYYGYRGYGYRDPFLYPPYYTYPQTIVIPATPPVYIQQEEIRPVQPQTNYWYYCRNPEGYYPYVRQCPDGWLQVAPQPSAH